MLTLCIPTLLKYDLCIKLLNSAEVGTLKPDAYVVIDNGGGFEKYMIEHTIVVPNLKIITPGTNLGVAKSWNWFITNISDWMIISNDDLVVHPDTIQKLVDVQMHHSEGYPDIIMFAPRCAAFSFFMVNASIKDKIGLFDETFYPAYFEDNDYVRRMALYGYRWLDIPDMEVPHQRSSTLNEQRRLGLNKEHAFNFNKNQQYYVNKWGDMPHHETFKTPFNK